MIKIKWLNLEINEKIYKKILMIGILVIACYFILTFLSFGIPKTYHMSENTVVAPVGMVNNGIDHLERGNLILRISGWAYQKGQAVETFNSYFVLKNKETEKMYQIKTGVKMVPELQFVDGYNCLNCGLESQSIVLGMKKGSYDLYIAYQNNGEDLLVKTDVRVEI